MRILALDTATRNCSVAILNSQSLMAESAGAGTQTHAIHLIATVRKVIAMAGLTLPEIEGFAVGRGPGSFTGLRIGLSTIKALAVASVKPVVGVSDLDALALQAGISADMVCPLMDARKGEVYFSRYRYEKGELQKLAPARVAALDEALSAIPSACVFIGDGARIYRRNIGAALGANASFAPDGQNTIRASTIGRLSLARFKRQDTDDVALLVPEYIRRSDAELGFGRKGILAQIQPV